MRSAKANAAQFLCKHYLNAGQSFSVFFVSPFSHSGAPSHLLIRYLFTLLKLKLPRASRRASENNWKLENPARSRRERGRERRSEWDFCWGDSLLFLKFNVSSINFSQKLLYFKYTKLFANNSGGRMRKMRSNQIALVDMCVCVSAQLANLPDDILRTNKINWKLQFIDFEKYLHNFIRSDLPPNCAAIHSLLIRSLTMWRR